jgi:hypothetical protein
MASSKFSSKASTVKKTVYFPTLNTTQIAIKLWQFFKIMAIRQILKQNINFPAYIKVFHYIIKVVQKYDKF